MKRILIIEDETAAARNLEALLREIEPDIRIEAVLESVEDSIRWLNENEPVDMIFSDIHLADGSAFSIFPQVEITSPLIFTTAYDHYALDAFKVNTLDYLLKPIKKEELLRAIDKLKNLSRMEVEQALKRTATVAQEMERKSKVFLVRHRDQVVPLDEEQVAFFHTSSERVTAYTFDGRRLPVEGALDTLADELAGDRFFRANRQYIVSRDAIKEITVWFGSRLTVTLCVAAPERLVVSKARVPVFKKWLAGE